MYKIAPKTPLACQPHDHSQCVSTALAEADALAGGVERAVRMLRG